MFQATNGKFYIKERSFAEWLTLLVFITPFVMSFFIELLGVSGIIKFVPDFSLFIILIMWIIKVISGNRVQINKAVCSFVIIFGAFFLYTLINYFLNYDSIFYYFWGVRNNFRFYIAFFAYIAYASDDIAEDFLKLFEIFFWIHFILSLFQFFILGYEQDYLGGIFGVQNGCNGYVIILLSIISIKSIIGFFNEKEKALKCLGTCAAVLLNAALSELKAFYVLFLIILFISALITSFSWKKVLLIFILSLLFFISYIILVSIFDHFKGFLSIENLWKFLTNETYSREDTMNRLSSISTISNVFLKTLPEQLFGMGLGNCDVSSISIFSTSFYASYSQTLYSVFSIAFLFLETGYIGIILYLVFFVACFIYPFVLQRKKLGNQLFNQMAMIMSVVAFFLFVYNSSLRTEAGYMVYFVLALPLIGYRQYEKEIAYHEKQCKD